MAQLMAQIALIKSICGDLAHNFQNLDDKGQRAQMRGNLVQLVIGVAVAVIVGVGVAIPIVNDVLSQSSVSGLTATIVGFIPVMLGVLIFVATVGPIMKRT